MKDWRFWFAEQRGTLMAIAIFIVMFIIYSSNHPAGFNAECGADRLEQGRAAGLCRHGPGACGDHRRH